MRKKTLPYRQILGFRYREIKELQNHHFVILDKIRNLGNNVQQMLKSTGREVGGTFPVGGPHQQLPRSILLWKPH